MDGPSPTAGRRLSLVLPAYNEAAVIRRAIAEADDALRNLTDDYEVLVVDDGSRDATAALAEEAARDRPRVRVLRHGVNRGYGAALRTGFEAAQFERVAFTDADCQFHLEDLGRLLPLADQAPLAVGYRVDRQDPWLRRFYSWGYNTLVRTLLGTRVRDCDCALKVFRRDALREILPTTTHFFVNTEMLTRARQRNLEVAEAGVRHRPRLGGASKVSLADVPRTLRVLLPFWWSEVLFGGAAPRTVDRGPWTVDRGPRSAPPLVFWFVLLLAALLTFSRLSVPLLEPDEARYAEIPRQMLAEDRLVVPVLHGQAYLDKPPLLYWVVMLSYRIFGVADWAARLVPSAAAFLGVVVAGWWALRTVGPRAATAGTLVLALSARYVYLARMLTPDSLLALWVVSAWAVGHVALHTGRLRRGLWLLSGLFTGLGLLTKGPVALVLVVPPLLLYALLDRRAARPRVAAWLAHLGVALAVALPWYAAVMVREPVFASYFFWQHNIVRYVAPFDHEEPFWFYIPGLLLGLMPWALLLPALARYVCRRTARAARRRPAALGVFLLTSLGCLAFFSLSGSKRIGYVLPALPPLALAFGCYLDAALRRERLERLGELLARHGSRLASGATYAALALGAMAALVAAASGLWAWSTALALAGAAATMAAVLVRLRRPALSWAVCAGVTFAVLWVGVLELLPAYHRRFSLRGLVRSHAEATIPVACYPRRWDSVSFYLQRDDVRVYQSADRERLMADLKGRPETLLFVKNGAALAEVLRELPPSLEFVPEGRQTQRLCVGRVRRRAVLPEFLYAGR